MLQLYRTNSKRLHVLRRYSQVVTHSESLTQEYRRHGVGCEKLRGFGSIERKQSGAVDWKPRDAWRLLMIGRMMPIKGGQLLLQALPLLARCLNRPIVLTMAGDGPSRPEWEMLAANIMRDHPSLEIAFVGWVTGETRTAIFAETDLLVVPSVWPEPFGLVGMEAAALGIPAVGFRAGGIPEWLHEGENGCLAPADPPQAQGLAAAMERCLGDIDVYRRLRAGAYQAAVDRHIESHYDDLMRVFERVTSSVPRVPVFHEALSPAEGPQ
jgi:glycosyltransferase involved in cell wall biosynthesis